MGEEDEARLEKFHKQDFKHWLEARKLSQKDECKSSSNKGMEEVRVDCVWAGFSEIFRKLQASPGS